MYHEYYPEVFIQLQLEVEHHPLLIQRLQKHSQLEVGVVFAECCHYCGFQIDAELDGEQLEALADTLLKRLQTMSIRQAVQQKGWQDEAWKFGVH